MDAGNRDGSGRRKGLRLWPGVGIAVLMVVLRFGVPAVVPEALPMGLLGALVGSALILLWWVLFSRAAWGERLGGVALVAGALLGTRAVLHESIATAAEGMLYPLYAVPTACVALVVWAALTRGLRDGARRATMVAAVLAACGAWALVRTSGVSGGFDWDFAWRWTATAEERLLARAGDGPAEGIAATAPDGIEAQWPGFRGARRDGVVRGVRIGTDWEASPPVELWRRPVGPGWSSFAVGGGIAYTQEQRGEEEIVAAYDLATGEPVWMHADRTRFWEAMAGAGPRGTPTLAGGRVYALGATGILNALDAADGGVVWSRDAAADAEATLPGWGFAGSPLVLGESLVVAVAGRLAAWDLATGEPRWEAGPDRESYGSPQRATIDGVEQVLWLTGNGLTAVDPEDGATLWEHPWKGFHSLQPAVVAGGGVLFASSGSAGGFGTRRLAVARGDAGWAVEERWTSRGLKPYFNDLVVHEGHAYGFDGRILACIDLATGERAWKGGRYGNGQVLLLADQDVLLVLSESGELALVAAVAEGFTELARIPALEGKTWNHPALVGRTLLVRNDREMAAFRLPAADAGGGA